MTSTSRVGMAILWDGLGSRAEEALCPPPCVTSTLEPRQITKNIPTSLSATNNKMSSKKNKPTAGGSKKREKQQENILQAVVSSASFPGEFHV